MGVGIALGGALVVLVLQMVNLSAVAGHLEHLDVTVALACGVVFLSAYVVRGLRWRRFLAPDVVAAPRVVGIYVVATFLNWLLPIQGGELAKSLMLRRLEGIPVSRSLATVGMDKTMDMLPAVALLALVPFVHLHISGVLWALLLIASSGVLAGACLLLLAAWRRQQTVARLSWVLGALLPARLSDRLEPSVVHFVDTFLALARRPRLLMVASAYTAVAVLLDALFCLLAFRAVGVVISPAVALYGYTLYNVAYVLPTPPAHVGTNELVGLLVFAGVFGVNRSGVAAMFVFSHPWTGVLLTTGGLLSLRMIGLNVRSALALDRPASSASSASPASSPSPTSPTSPASSPSPAQPESFGCMESWESLEGFERAEVEP